MPSGPVAKAFHESDAFIRGLMGPVGSSKSSACCIEIFTRACEQAAHNGRRRTRWGVVRNTYPQLKSTTIKTWTEWFPESIAPMKWDQPISSHILVPLADKTVVECEVLFLALDREADTSKLRSLELTGGWMNEASEMGKPILDMLSQRVGRFPPQKWGGATWSGVIMDTNPPDDDHWWFRMAEGRDLDQERKLEEMLREHGSLKGDQKLLEFFKQPGGLVLEGGEYRPNPLAENIPNLPGGYGYYIRQLVGKSPEWVKVFVLGQYGTVSSGRPVYPEYSDELHCKPVEAVKNVPLILGFDYGLTPACVIAQVTPRGQFIVLDELCSDGMGIQQFARDVVKPFLSTRYVEWVKRGDIQAVGDPAGNQKSQTDAKTCFQELADEGIICMPAMSNDILARITAVKKFLIRLTDKNPAFAVSPRCQMLRRGFLGRYCYERVHVAGRGEVYRDKPVKNDYSHIHDALQYACMHAGREMLSSWSTKDRIVYPELGVV